MEVKIKRKELQTEIERIKSEIKKLMLENTRFTSFNGQFLVLLKQKLNLKTLGDINSTTAVINVIDKFLALPRKEINATSFEIEDDYIIIDNSMFNLKRFKIIEALLNSKEETKYYIFDEQPTSKKLLFVTPNGIALAISDSLIS